LLLVFQRYDVNADQEIDYKEFSKIFLGEIPDYTAPEDPYLKEKTKREQASAAIRGDTPDKLLQLLKDRLRARGARGLIGLHKLFKMMDDDESNTLSLPEFVKVCRDFKVGINEENVPILFKAFDSNQDGTLNYKEFIETLRGPMPAEREQLVR
jgi:Ca2+-binding EF-hand superfamily protein